MWLLFWIVVTTIGALGVLVVASDLRLDARIRGEVADLHAAPPLPPASEPGPALPAPVERYLSLATSGRRAPIRTVLLRHGGTLSRDFDKPPLDIRGEQHFTANPPGFVWRGHVAMLPGVWMDARDRSVGGRGQMTAWLDSTVRMVDVTGPALDTGALLRLLGEMVWFPTAYADARFVTWTAVDEHSARATLRVADREVSAEFRFGADGMPTTVLAERMRDVDGKGVLTPWLAECDDFRDTDGLKVPFRVEVSWLIDGRKLTYARWRLESLELDAPPP